MTSPVSGFRFSAVSAGLRKDGRIDVALAAASAPATCAGVFTRNLVRAAPVDVAAERVRSGRARAVLANSGTANACTGQAGFEAVLASTEAIARALGVPSSSVLPASTGVIGKLLEARRVAARAADLVATLSPDGFSDFARAIGTTDRWEKIAEARAGAARVLGIAKGAGMIHPDLGVIPPGPPHATMLAFLFTDAAVDRAGLERALVHAVDTSFNACSVDGDTSTNDTVIALASGAAGVCDADELARATSEVCDALARSMIADGEGATHAVEVRVTGLATDAEARQVARTIATSMLVKTALFAQDPNWGRLLAAAGRAGVRFDPARARIAVGGVAIVRDGVALGAEAEAEAARHMIEPSYVVDLVLGSGPGSFTYLTSDLGHGYVDVNAGYRS
jgi:glutamate N-acetyltransferase / amino-acid N-acetyltransferase